MTPYRQFQKVTLNDSTKYTRRHATASNPSNDLQTLLDFDQSHWIALVVAPVIHGATRSLRGVSLLSPLPGAL